MLVLVPLSKEKERARRRGRGGVFSGPFLQVWIGSVSYFILLAYT